MMMYPTDQTRSCAPVSATRNMRASRLITFVVPMTRNEVGLTVKEGVIARDTINHGIVEHYKLIVRGGEMEIMFFGCLALKESCDLIVDQVKVPRARAS